jgi:hypothetical protein
MMHLRFGPWPVLAILFSITADALAGPLKPADLPPRSSALFATLAQQQPRPCEAAMTDAASPPGWRLTATHCAWRGLLQVRYWALAPGGGTAACISPQAKWWSWARQRLTPGAGTAWHHKWTSNALHGEKNGIRRFVTLSGSDAGGWTGVEWTWWPSPRSATRQWQQGRWQLIAASTQAVPTAVPIPGSLGEFITAAWERNLRGRPGEMAADALRWESGGVCLNLQAAAPTEMPFPLAYERADVRLEQLAAMQVQLARRHPDARWLVPFKLLDDGERGMSGGAKYEAIWSDKANVVGQLWMPSKEKGPTLRISVSANSAGANGSAANATTSAGIGDGLHVELLSLARLLGERHDR